MHNMTVLERGPHLLLRVLSSCKKKVRIRPFQSRQITRLIPFDMAAAVRASAPEEDYSDILARTTTVGECLVYQVSLHGRQYLSIMCLRLIRFLWRLLGRMETNLPARKGLWN